MIVKRNKKYQGKKFFLKSWDSNQTNLASESILHADGLPQIALLWGKLLKVLFYRSPPPPSSNCFPLAQELLVAHWNIQNALGTAGKAQDQVGSHLARLRTATSCPLQRAEGMPLRKHSKGGCMSSALGSPLFEPVV